MEFVEKYVKLPEKAPPEQKTWFEKRPWLNELYHDESNRIIIVKGRQMEISEFAVNWIFYWALKKPGKYIYASSSGAKADIFSKDRFQNQLKRSPDLQRLVKAQAVRRVILGNSQIYFMTAFEDTETLRSIDADAIVLDEIQDYRANAVPIAEAGISHSSFDRMLVIGTPLLTGTNFSRLQDNSNKKEWIDGKWEITNHGYDGLWTGYHISEEFAVNVWITPAKFEYMKKHKPRQEFMNEVLGLFYSGLGRPTDYGYMRTLFSPVLEKGKFGKGDLLYAGVDWGVSKANTVFFLIRPRIIELPDIYTIDTLYVEKLDSPDHMAQIDRIGQLLTTFPVALCACDYGSGYIQNEELYKKFGNRIMSVKLGSGKAGKPISIEPTQFGALAQVNRTWAIDTAMDYVTKPERFRFYNEPDEGTRDWIIEDFLAEYPEVSSATGAKVWNHSTDTNDDALMAFVNAIVAFHLNRGTSFNQNVEDVVAFV